MTPERNINKNKISKKIFPLMISILCIYFFFKQVNESNFQIDLYNFKWIYIFFGISALTVGYLLRIFRWSIVLNASKKKVSFKNCCAPFLASITLNNILPLRLGDVIRATVFPISMGITRSNATASLIFERLIDIITLVICFCLGILVIKKIDVPFDLKILVLITTLISITFLSCIFFWSNSLKNFFNNLVRQYPNKRFVYSLGNFISNSFHNLEAVSRPRILFWVLFISILLWFAEASLFYFIMLGFGLKNSFLGALLIMAVSTLSTLIPSSPGYIGTFHLAAYSAIMLLGADVGKSASFAVLIHLCLWLPTTLAGALAIYMNPKLFKLSLLKNSI